MKDLKTKRSSDVVAAVADRGTFRKPVCRCQRIGRSALGK